MVLGVGVQGSVVRLLCFECSFQTFACYGFMLRFSACFLVLMFSRIVAGGNVRQKITCNMLFNKVGHCFGCCFSMLVFNACSLPLFLWGVVGGVLGSETFTSLFVSG